MSFYLHCYLHPDWTRSCGTEVRLDAMAASECLTACSPSSKYQYFPTLNHKPQQNHDHRKQRWFVIV